MCGRTACTLAPDDISKACAYRDNQGKRKKPEWRNGDSDKYKPSYNKSPQSNSPVLLSRNHFEKDVDTSERVIASMRWGLIPSWFSEQDPRKMQYNTTNCRSDTIMEKTLYKGPLLKGKRCVILANGFYEWKRHNEEKQPYYIYFPQPKEEKMSEETDDSSEWKGCRLLTMAGLFDCWEPHDGGDPLYSYTVITVNASKCMNWLHDRMPAILDGDEAIQKWLNFGEVSTQEALQLIHPIENIAFHPVSTRVNNSRNNTPECIIPIELGVKKEPTLSASSKRMFEWLKSKSPKKEEPDSPGLQSCSAKTPKQTSAGLMHQWLKKEEREVTAKKLKLN
ncbi:abasic site processing protein HMCES isoform X1 [Microcaecilia unicolor]|uniref:Abasic site processing protein HMCES n=1 Tax=Microcaecilia unicolor TaxID=1415580 RepID=A0A6P7YHS0_9AMPH|nr:abasic site processing protein HMCES isoform X1 [Microcaecilia unicolor]XP_030062578.1 abasic site processing protein HMCES isoform X1 [Microcaecilia unicolor]XP_030062579.1 abasic site processing protein HMCES isoform X1 [Microcaecilia unicolor]XP_030062580.1 abasic site processing protein HMCES isoform X1 [Microcaecilia unicolor]